MKERMERFAAFPFSVGCVSQSSVDVVENQPKKLQAESNRTTSRLVLFLNEGEVQSNGRLKSSFQKVIKSLSYLFQFYKEVDDGDEDEIEMVIGFPTDVKHVAHIGWDGFNSGSNGITKSWDKSNSEILSLPTISLKQFEIAMANQANDVHPHPPIGPHFG